MALTHFQPHPPHAYLRRAVARSAGLELDAEHPATDTPPQAPAVPSIQPAPAPARPAPRRRSTRK